nr:hypothetical protein [Empedobacter sp.]
MRRNKTIPCFKLGKKYYYCTLPFVRYIQK